MSKTGYVLTIAVGNSNVLFGIFAGNKYLSKWRIETRSNRAADEYGAWLMSIFEHVDIDPKFVSGAIISSVVPGVDKVITSMCRRFFDVEPLFVTPGIKTGMNINYGRAGDLGPDRLANIVALNTEYGHPALVIDFGSTTSFDVIDEKGVYQGGALAPGVALALAALSDAAPQLPEVALLKPEKIVGRNIVESMQSGCFWGAVEMVEGVVHRIWQEMGIEDGRIIVTGGYAREMNEGLLLDTEVDTNLTLKGLKLIYDRNAL